MTDSINVNDLKPGITFLKNNEIFIVLDALHSKSGRGQAHVKVKARNLLSKNLVNITFTGGTKVKQAFIENKIMAFLFFDNKDAFFMEQKSFEQFSIPLIKLSKIKDFLMDGLEIKVLFFSGEIVDIEFPKTITLKVISAENTTKGDTVNMVMKKATLETGTIIDVPHFIKSDDSIVINLETKSYVSKVKK